MAFQVSPGVNVTEIDLTTIVPAVSTTEGAIAGVFKWGPVEERYLVSSEDELVLRFGRPTSDNFETWFTAANFLAYGNKLYVSRAVGDANTTKNAVVGANAASTIANTQIKNQADYDTETLDANALFIAKWPGALGNSLKISVCDSANAFSSILTGNSDSVANITFSRNSNSISVVVTSATSNTNANTMANSIISSVNIGDYIRAGNSTVGYQYMKVSGVGVPSITANSVATVLIDCKETFNLSANVSVNAVSRYWEFFNVVDAQPGTSAYTERAGGTDDELHVVVIDEDGEFSGVRGQVLEVFKNLSRATDAKGEQGGSIYYKDVLNLSSQYVWWANHRTGAGYANTAQNMTAVATAPYIMSFKNGADGISESNVSLSSLATAYDRFKSAEDLDISLILTGKSANFGVNGEGLANYLIDNIAEYRKDCVVFVSPQREDVVNVPGNEASNIVTFRNSLRSTSYAVLDSGYKYQYDKYNDIYRWVPLNGDVAGLCVRTDELRDPWFSPAGFNRGQIKNVVRLAYNPDKADRDILYKSGANPVVNFIGEGTVLYGDKTLLAKPSAFDRINVRRLFIVLEKAIATAAKYTLFEFNDEFTRATFRNLVEPYLRDVKGRRGIYDFRVVCDDTNNTPERIDRNEFWGDIYIKPARSINFIQLNFVAVRTGVEFDEVVGKF